MSDIKVGDKFLGFEFTNGDTEASNCCGWVDEFYMNIKKEITVLEVYDRQVFTSEGWYPSDHPKFKIIGKEEKKEKK